MAETRQKFTKFCFTLNNFTEDEESAIRSYAESNAKYSIIGHEVGDNGTPHLQGYMNLGKQVRFTAIKKIMPRAHIEIAHGNDSQNREYCAKDKDFWEIGEPQRSGKRNDLQVVCQKIVAGSPVTAVAVEHPEVYVKYHRGISALAQAIAKPRDVNDPPTTLWIWGASGVGKTRFAYDNMPHEQIYVKDGTQWWDGYDGQQCILVDDFDGRWPFRDFLRFTDRYPYRGQTKGGYVQLNSPIIIVTCEYPPSHFWSDNDLAQVLRRFQHVIELKPK